MKKQIAFFDFDGTITSKDSFLEFIKFQKGRLYFYVGLLMCSPWLLGYTLGLLSNSMAKEKLITFFFKNQSIENFNNDCSQFSSVVLKKIIRIAALQKMEQLKLQGFEIVIVSASIENWLQPCCTKNNIKLIATKLQIVDNKLTGKMEGLNCNAAEKLRRIKDAYNLANYETIYCYGNTKGDKPMLGVATKSFYRYFK
jgi:phosphatidylglycerophosphatase C